MNYRARQFLSSVLCLVLMAGVSGCFGPPPGKVYASSSEETYFLQAELNPNLDTGISETLSNEIERRLSALLLEPGLSYRVSYGKDYTALHDGPVRAYWTESAEFRNQLASNSVWLDPHFILGDLDDPYSEEDVPSGEIEVIGDIVNFSISFAATQDGFGRLECSGSFDRGSAQHAIDRLRKSEYQFVKGEFGQEGNEQFVVNWTVSGSFEGEAFSLPVTQQFRARRVRYSTPI